MKAPLLRFRLLQPTNLWTSTAAAFDGERAEKHLVASIEDDVVRVYESRSGRTWLVPLSNVAGMELAPEKKAVTK